MPPNLPPPPKLGNQPPPPPVINTSVPAPPKLPANIVQLKAPPLPPGVNKPGIDTGAAGGDGR